MPPGGATPFGCVRRACAVVATLTLCAWCLLFGATPIRGGSMEPTLYPGDVVFYRRGCSMVGEGDVVLFAKTGWRGGVVHRVVGLAGDGALWTCGDANKYPDADAVSQQDVRGVVVAVLPLGKAWRAIQTGVSNVLHSSTNRTMQSDDGEAIGASVPPGTEPHRLGGLRGRAGRFTPSAAT